MKKNKRLLLIIVFSLFTCLLISSFYIILRFILLEKGYSISDLLSFGDLEHPVQVIENQVSSEASEIPGITQENFRERLNASGYACTQPELSDNELYRWVCWKEEEDASQEIYVFSQGLEEINFIDMNITQSGTISNELAADLFTSITEFYDNGSYQEEILNWISTEMPEIDEIRELRETNINGIHYRLYGLPEARSLEIGVLP